MGHRIIFQINKANLQIKIFVGTSENAFKSQIYIALICYLLLELINRTIAKTTKSFSNFVEKIRICLVFYLSIEYVCNQVGDGVKKATRQTKIAFETDFFFQ